MDYMTVREAAEKWAITQRRVQQLCKDGDIEYAVREGRTWMIPEDASVSLRPRLKRTDGRRPLPVGVSSYTEAVTNYYYVDKTLLIRDILESMPKVSLFTRPRRFGKTLNMDMLKVFFEKTDSDTSVYFRDKNIWACGGRFREHQGKYPVIFLSFKDVKYTGWEDALKSISAIIADEYRRHGAVADAEGLDPHEREYFELISSGTSDTVMLGRSLQVLSSMLHRHYGAGAVIIIDEYDTPIQQGYVHGYYDDVIGLIRNLFSGAFKDNRDLAFGFLTGILRVAKESIFSGLNNLKVNSIMDDRYSGYFGFTREEVAEMLRYYTRGDRIDEVCSWYDGYRFGKTEIFNPWSVINYIDDGCVPKAFWLSTGSNDVIGELIGRLTGSLTEKLRRLMQGEQITAYIDIDVIYPRLSEDPSGIFSFLLMTGYLKNGEVTQQEDGNYVCGVSIPNREISFVYAREIIARLGNEQTESTAMRIRQAVFEYDTEALCSCLEEYLMQTVSFYDSSSEAFYQGLMIGLCAVLNNRYSVRSNREAGLGRFDIQLCPIGSGLPSFIFELKATKDKKADLQEFAKQAAEQIDIRRYDAELIARNATVIVKVGVAFRGKQAAVWEKRT